MKTISENTKFVEVKTKCNYRGLNGKLLTVAENHINFVACWFTDELGERQKADFGKSEVIAEYSSKESIPPFIYN